MPHISCSLTALNVLFLRLRSLLFMLAAVPMTQIAFPFCLLFVLATFHNMVPPHDITESYSPCQPVHFPPSHVPHALRRWASCSQHKTAKQDVHDLAQMSSGDYTGRDYKRYSVLQTHHLTGAGDLGSLSTGGEYLLTWIPYLCVTPA